VSKSSPGGQFSSEACVMLVKIRDKRTKYKADQQDLIKARKKLDEDLKRMGTKRTPERLTACANYRDVLDGIEMCRAQQQFLADTTDKLIEYAAQGRFIDDSTLEEIEDALKGEDLPLYEKLVEEVGAVDDDEEVGEPSAAAESKRGRKPPRGQAEAQAAVAGDTDMDALKKDKDRWSKPLSIVVQDEPLALLNKVGLQTLGNLYWFMRKDGKPMDLGVTREISEALWLFLDDLSDNNLKPPPEGMHVEQPKPPNRGGKAKA
jgi:hypothetical protein